MGDDAPLLQIIVLPPKDNQFIELLQGMCTNSTTTLLILYNFLNYFSWHILVV